VEVRGLWVEEGERLGGSVNAARDEKFGEDERQTRFAGEDSGLSELIRRGPSEDPALRRQSAS
jgi:hypothetical protein